MLPPSNGFSLLELLSAIGVLALLAAIAAAALPAIQSSSVKSKSLGNMRQIGVGFQLYAGDHDYALPGRITGESDRWPKLLVHYLSDDPKVYAAPEDEDNYLVRRADPLSNTANNTSYIMNGYNDMGALDNPGFVPRIHLVESPSRLILLGTPKSGSTHFYMDLLEGRNGNHIDVLNLEAFEGGSNYLFADGSGRFIKKVDYDHRMWLLNPDFIVPGS